MKQELLAVAEALGLVRQIGKTTHTARTAKELGAIVLCANKAQADQVSQQHQVATLSTQNPERIKGFKGPFVADHFAIESILYRSAGALEQAEEQTNQEQQRALRALELVSAWSERATLAEDRLRLAVEALEWYANMHHCDTTLETLRDATFVGQDVYGDVRVEDGSRARTTLAKLRGEGE